MVAAVIFMDWDMVILSGQNPLAFQDMSRRPHF